MLIEATTCMSLPLKQPKQKKGGTKTRAKNCEPLPPIITVIITSIAFF